MTGTKESDKSIVFFTMQSARSDSLCIWMVEYVDPQGKEAVWVFLPYLLSLLRCRVEGSASTNRLPDSRTYTLPTWCSMVWLCSSFSCRSSNCSIVALKVCIRQNIRWIIQNREPCLLNVRSVYIMVDGKRQDHAVEWKGNYGAHVSVRPLLFNQGPQVSLNRA